MSVESFQFGEDDIQSLMSVVPPPEAGNSFTALLELPPNQAVKLLHSPEETTPSIFPPSVFPTMDTDNSLETTSSILPNSSPNFSNLVKQEPIDSDSPHNSSPMHSDPIISKLTKRKEREKKVCATFRIIPQFYITCAPSLRFPVFGSPELRTLTVEEESRSIGVVDI